MKLYLAMITLSLLQMFTPSVVDADSKSKQKLNRSNHCDFKLQETDALLVLDVQNDFMASSPYKNTPNYPIPDSDLNADKSQIKAGSLAVANTIEIIDPINQVVKDFEAKGLPTFFSLDWHPASHCSFCRNGTADSNPLYYKEEGGFCGPLTEDTENSEFLGLKNRCQDDRSIQNFKNTALGIMQWPDHCKAGHFGSRFHPYLYVPKTAQVIKKGFQDNMDAYSAFQGVLSKQGYPFDTAYTESDLLRKGKVTPPPTLKSLLEENQTQRLFVVGIATDYTVKWSAIDAMEIVNNVSPSFLKEVNVVLPLTRWVAESTRDQAVDAMSSSGATILQENPFA